MPDAPGLLAGLTDAQIAGVRLACEKSQHYFTRFMFKALEGKPFRVGRHHKIIDDTLDRVVSGEIYRLIINEPPGYSKAIDNDTPMWTPNGWVRAGDIRPGDRLIGSDGKWTTVLAIHPQGVKPAFNVAFSDGTSLVACDEHRWAVRQRYSALYHVRTTEQLREDLYEADGRKKWRIPVLIDTKEDEVDLPIEPYLLGCWLGDGHTRSAEITNMDPEIVEAFAPYDPTPKKHQNSGKATTYYLHNGFRTKLRLLGLIGRKHIPAVYMMGSRSQRLALLQGMFDTDGWVGAANGQQGVSFSNKQIADDVRALISSLGGVWRGFESPAGKKIAYKTFVSMPVGMCAFRLPRKVERIRARKECNTPRRFIDTIEPVEPREMVCFTVDAADHLFCAGRDFIVTHNTLQAVQMFAARGFALNPRARFLHTSYSRALVDLNSAVILDVMRLPEYQWLWHRALRKDSAAKSLWRTPEGGAFKASPAGGGVTGFRAGTMDDAEEIEEEDELEQDLEQIGDAGETFSGALIIDDPLKPDDASSDVKRDFVNKRYMNTFRSRLAHERVPIVVTMQRIHRKDFSQHLLTGGGGEKFHHLMLPVLIDRSKGYPTEFTSGIEVKHDLEDGPLWTLKHNLDQIEVLKKDSKVYSAQYGQNPSDNDNAIFSPTYFRPYEVRPRTLNVAIIVDPSRGRTQRSDRTAMPVIGVDSGGNKYLLDGFCHRMKLSERWENLRRLWLRWSRATGVMTVIVGYEQYGLQSDVEYIQERQEIEGVRFPVTEVNWVREGSQSKEDRIQRLEPDFKASRFYLPATVYRPGETTERDCFWTGEKHGVEFRPAFGKTSAQKRIIESGEAWRVAETLKRRDENNKLYDLSWLLMEELQDFPNAIHDDLSDAASRIYDLGIVPAPKAEVNEVMSLNEDLVA